MSSRRTILQTSLGWLFFWRAGDSASKERPMPSTSNDRLYGLTTSVAVKPACRVATSAAITPSTA
jgi:hypothetical protein